MEIGRTIPALVDKLRFNQIRMAERELGAFEKWHNVGDVGEIALEGGWVNLDPANYNVLSYFKDNGKKVHWRGIIRNLAPSNIGTSGYTRVCTIPDEWNPEFREFHLTGCNVSVGGGPYLYTWTVMLFDAATQGMYVNARDSVGRTASFSFVTVDNHGYWIP